VDQYSIPLSNGRSLSVSADQLRRIARGLGGQLDAQVGNQDSAIVRALKALPPSKRADALSVVVLRFGEKLDIESIALQRNLTSWQVWELEESFRRALADAQADTSQVEGELRHELAASPTARVMSAEMLSNAMAHGERVDLDREHESSLRG
jgi:CHAD domain-containing protein